MTTNSVVACATRFAHQGAVLTKIELLRAIRAKGIANIAVGEVIDKPSSRVSEIFRALPESKSDKQPRELTYDEGVKLVRAFGFEQTQEDRPPHPLPNAVLRSVARYVANSLGVEPSEELLQDLSEDLRAFAGLVADPKVQKTVESAEAFFRGVRFHRPEAPAEAPQGSDPRLAL